MVVMFSTVVSFINKCSFRSYKFDKVDTFSSKLTTLAWHSLIFRSLYSKLEFIYPLWAWGEQMLISSSCLTPGRVIICKHLKSTSVRHLITTRSHHWATAQTREWNSYSNVASDSVRSGPTNYEDSTPEWASDTFAYRSPNKNPFLPFGYPRVKKGKSYNAGSLNSLYLCCTLKSNVLFSLT